MKAGKAFRIPVMLAMLSVVFWSFAATAFKKALFWETPWMVVFAGSLVSALVLLSALVLMGKRIECADVKQGAFFGFLNPFLYYLVLLNAYNGLPAQIAMVVNYLWPVVLVLLAVPILGQKLTPGGLAGTMISFLGVVLLALLGQRSFEFQLFPLILAFFSTVVWAVYWLLNTRSTGDTNSVLLMCFAFGTLYLAVFGAVSGQHFIPRAASVPWLLYIGVFEMGITYLLWNTALKRAPSASSVGNLIFLAPFLALVPISLVVGEGIRISTVAGLLLVVGGILVEKHFRAGRGKNDPD